MDAILLKRKPESPIADGDLVVFDEIFKSVLTAELFLPVFTGADKGMRVIPLSYLIDNYLFPEKEGQITARVLHFFKSYDPIVFETISFYELDEIDISMIK